MLFVPSLFHLPPFCSTPLLETGTKKVPYFIGSSKYLFQLFQLFHPFFLLLHSSSSSSSYYKRGGGNSEGGGTTGTNGTNSQNANKIRRKFCSSFRQGGRTSERPLEQRWNKRGTAGAMGDAQFDLASGFTTTKILVVQEGKGRPDRQTVVACPPSSRKASVNPRFFRILATTGKEYP